MTICDEGHDEIVYSGKDCPCCELKDRVHDLQQEAGGLQEEIDDLKKEPEK